MNLKIRKGFRGSRRFAHANEKGFTLVEVLVTLAVLALAIGITAAALAGRAEQTRIDTVASQIAQVVSQRRAQTIINPNMQVNMRALGSELDTVLASVSGVSSVTGVEGTGTAPNRPCSGGVAAARRGFTITLVSPYDEEQANVLSSSIGNQINTVFSGSVAGVNGLSDVFSMASGSTAVTTIPTAGGSAPSSSTSPFQAHVCLDN